MDDSGTRHPDKGGTKTPQGYDWFGLGGIYVREEDEAQCREAHRSLCDRWKVSEPLHSVKIRNQKGHFAWLGKVNRSCRAKFLTHLNQTLTDLPVLGIACVIDRPGYNNRYQAPYGDDRWKLCRTAFAIVVERAAKFAASEGRKLNISIERSDKRTDRDIKNYFQTMKQDGMPFASQPSSKYSPLDASALGSTLYDLSMKNKSSPMVQYADLYLYPLCRGGYEPSYRPYSELKEAGRLLDSQLEATERAARGIKYSCFELVQSRSPKG
ncbi:MAG TPA: DUF3800 domain-containing protein [Nannocystis exedens]|nr:DUF3800 domain-containing protein [Nannocystis exedens]